MEGADYFFCDYCKRYYLNMFTGHHDKQHKYMILKIKSKQLVGNDLLYERFNKMS